VNLSWTLGGQHPIETPPLEVQNNTSLPPPVPNKKLLAEYTNQKPDAGRSSGFVNQSHAGSPTLGHIVPEDLLETRRTLELFEQACAKGKIPMGEAGRLQFIAGAEHALRVGSKNVCGLFAAIVRRGLWQFVSQHDEDNARRRLTVESSSKSLMRTRETNRPTNNLRSLKTELHAQSAIGLVIAQLQKSLQL
jgi:hypothetical protein